MSLSTRSAPSGPLLVLLFALPAAHPLLIPVVGVPSHLLWWVHVLPVALLTFHRGRRAAWMAVALSAVLVALGEMAFGAGYGRPASAETVVALTAAVTATNLLVVWFALHARAVGTRYRLLLDTVPAGVLRVAPDGTVLAANQAARELLGQGAGPLDGRAVDQVVALPRGEAVLATAGQGGWTGSLEVGAEHARSTVPVFLLAIRDPDEAGYQVVVVDRSLEVAREQELERQSKLAALGEALAGVAHELNNPLTSVLAQAQLGATAAEEGWEEDPAEAFRVIEEEAERMRDLIRELLGFSRARAEGRWVSLGPLLERLVRVRRMALPDGVELATAVEWHGSVRGSPAKVEQILLNLLSNAVWELEQRGGGRIELRVALEGDEALLQVRDDGPGVPHSLLPRIFEPFLTTKPEGEGTGLGLAISRRLARSWGGELEAGNAPGGGAVFTLRLPVAPAGLGGEERPAPTPAAAARQGAVGTPSLEAAGSVPGPR